MKTGIFIALAALALAVFAVPDAYGMEGADLHMKIFGGNHISSDTDGVPTLIDGGAITAIQSGKTKGSGSPSLFSTTALEAVDLSNLPTPGCPAAMPLGSGLSSTVVLTYQDGSLLSLTTEPGSSYCSDGTLFTVDFFGTVAGGNGRFEDATGTWEGTAVTFPGGRFTGEISVDLD
jgi:hypothetical protein